jgi:hypothetical protein
MDNQSIQFLLLAALALAAQLLLAWALLALGRRAGIGLWRTIPVIFAAAVLLASLGLQWLPEQLPICTGSFLGYMHCLGL